MSLRAKLTWAFLVVVLVALVPALLILNAGFNMEATGPGMMRGQMMRQGQMPARAYIEMARRWSVVASVAAVAVAGVTGFWTASRITRSLRSLRDAAHRLDLRDLSGRVPVEGKDEIADLASTFNVMCERLEAEERSRRHLLADVAHELRHPLAVMKGRLELMQEDRAPIDQESLLPLQDEVIRLTRLVEDLRDLSLAEVGGLSLHRSRLELGVLLDRLCADLEPVAAAKSVDLALHVETPLPALDADPDRMRQVFVNLISNALQYTPAGGSVSVTAWHDGPALRICVRDTGPGIAPNDLPRIFDRFFRADRSRSRGTGGSGLGLAIVRSLIELHQGRVEAQSRPGEGTAVTVTLPVGR